MTDKVHIPLTPPPKLSREFMLSPTTFLKEELENPRLSQKIAFTLTPTGSKSVKLYPSPKTEDITMGAYLQRVQSTIVTNDSLTLSLPPKFIENKFRSEIKVR